MTDSVNRDRHYSLTFDFYIPSPTTSEPKRETAQHVTLHGRSWEVTFADTVETPKPQLFFAAKSGKLFSGKVA